MIVHDQLLPSLYHMQRLGRIGGIAVCAQHGRTVQALRGGRRPGAGVPRPDVPRVSGGGDPDRPQPDLFRELVARLPPRNLVVVAMPDHLHFDVIMTALRHDQHVCTVKPLVLRHAEALEIAREAYARGLVVGVEYHKRFDDRSRMARRKYRAGLFGEFKLGTACLLEKWYYRNSNFQNWMTCENSDAFTYIGCHYVDLVHFITGLMPAAVSVYGIRDRFPNGKEGFLWTDARVIWNNGACLNVQNALGFPDAAPGTNTQGLVMYCSGAGGGGLHRARGPIPRPEVFVHAGGQRAGRHDLRRAEPGLFPVRGVRRPKAWRPSGYGYRSRGVHRGSGAAGGSPRRANLAARQRMLREIDAAGLMATPANSSYNELVIEAARESILNGGRLVPIPKRVD